MTPLALYIVGTLSVILNAIGMAHTNAEKSKFFVGLAVTLIIPDLYYSGGLHGALQSVIIAILFFLGAFKLKNVEKFVKFFLPVFTLYLLLKLQEPIGTVLVIAGITTTLATIAKSNYDIKRLLLVSLVCWGTYGIYYGAWFTVAFDTLGLFGIIYSFYKEKKLAANKVTV